MSNKLIRGPSKEPCPTWWQTQGQHQVVDGQGTHSYKQEDSQQSHSHAIWQVANVMKEAQLHPNVLDPAQAVDIVLELKHNSLLIMSKVVEANYLTVFILNEVQIFDGNKTKIASMMEPIIWGWNDQQSGLWWVPILPGPSTENSKQQKMTRNVNLPSQNQRANNVYKLPSTKQIIHYHNAAAGFPTKATWIWAIKAVYYARWPMLMTAAVNKYSP